MCNVVLPHRSLRPLTVLNLRRPRNGRANGRRLFSGRVPGASRAEPGRSPTKENAVVALGCAMLRRINGRARERSVQPVRNT
eukprot:7915993-Lingulodinium_polyedra.AAC.1